VGSRRVRATSGPGVSSGKPQNPLACPSPVSHEAHIDVSSDPAQSTGETPRSMRILFVDDESTLRFVVPRLLASQGYLVDAAADAAEALQLFAAAQSAYDLLLTDFDLPTVDGAVLITALRAAGFTGGVVVFSGGAVTSARSKRLKALGVDRIVSKGDPPHMLLGIIGQALLPVEDGAAIAPNDKICAVPPDAGQ